MKFSLVTLHVKDMEKALAFYNGLLEMPIAGRQPIAPGKELIFLGGGDVKLELVPSDTEISYSGFSVGFDVEDLSAVKKRLSDNGYSVKNEYSPAPNLTLAFLDGPCGEEVELIERK